MNASEIPKVADSLPPDLYRRGCSWNTIKLRAERWLQARERGETLRPVDVSQVRFIPRSPTPIGATSKAKAQAPAANLGEGDATPRGRRPGPAESGPVREAPASPRPGPQVVAPLNPPNPPIPMDPVEACRTAAVTRAPIEQCLTSLRAQAHQIARAIEAIKALQGEERVAEPKSTAPIGRTANPSGRREGRTPVWRRMEAAL